MTDPPAEPTATVTVPDTLTQQLLAKLAREMAIGIYEEDKILGRFGLTAEQYKLIAAIPFYDQMLKTFTIEWHSAKSTPDRIKLEAAAILEEALPHLGARMTSPEDSLAMQVQAGQLLAKLIGIGEGQQAHQQGEKFVISINLGADTERYDVTRPPQITVETEQRQISADQPKLQELVKEVRAVTEGGGADKAVSG